MAVRVFRVPKARRNPDPRPFIILPRSISRAGRRYWVAFVGWWKIERDL